MTILNQILGSSFGRSPYGALPLGGGVHMPQPMTIPQFAPQRFSDTRAPMMTPTQQPGSDIHNQFVQGRADLQDQGLHGPDFRSALDALRASLGMRAHHPHGNDAGSPPVPTTGSPADGGIMGSIMQAFNGGYGGPGGGTALDMNKLMQMATMMGAG